MRTEWTPEQISPTAPKPRRLNVATLNSAQHELDNARRWAGDADGTQFSAVRNAIRDLWRALDDAGDERPVG